MFCHALLCTFQIDSWKTARRRRIWNGREGTSCWHSGEKRDFHGCRKDAERFEFTHVQISYA